MEYQKVYKVRSARDDKYINELLEVGWVYLYARDGSAVLGWLDGENPPPKTATEKYLEEAEEAGEK